MTEQFSEEYYEDGVSSGLSLYKNYRWLPKLTIPMAASIATNLRFIPSSSILDYGCAKGFLVKAFKYLGYQSYGFDISEYAIANADPEIKDNVFSNITLITQQVSCFDWIISKDVLEHIPYEALPMVLADFKRVAKRAFIIVPLSAESGQPYIAPEYELDKTHIIRNLLNGGLTYSNPSLSINSPFRWMVLNHPGFLNIRPQISLLS